MSISGITGAPSVPFVPQPRVQANPGGTSAAATPVQHIAVGNHRPPANPAAPTQETGAEPHGPVSLLRSAGVDTVA